MQECVASLVALHAGTFRKLPNRTQAASVLLLTLPDGVVIGPKVEILRIRFDAARGSAAADVILAGEWLSERN